MSIFYSGHPPETDIYRFLIGLNYEGVPIEKFVGKLKYSLPLARVREGIEKRNFSPEEVFLIMNDYLNWQQGF